MPMMVHATQPPVLIVDDDEETRVAFRDTLQSAGYPVVEAANGRKALNYLTSDAPEPCLVLVDLSMPEMDGRELVALMTAYTRLSSIPVVLISGGPPENLQPGTFAQYLRKPFSEEALLQAVRANARRPLHTQD